MDDAHAQLHDLIKDQRTCLLTTRRADGSLTSRPMACQDREFDGTLWFFTESGSDKVTEISADPHVNVSFPKEGAWVSIAGTAEVVRDAEKAKELWNDFAEAWFQTEPTDPKVALLKVDADSAEFWDTPGKVGQLIGVVKAKVTGDQPDVGEAKTVEL